MNVENTNEQQDLQDEFNQLILKLTQQINENTLLEVKSYLQRVEMQTNKGFNNSISLLNTLLKYFDEQDKRLDKIVEKRTDKILNVIQQSNNQIDKDIKENRVILLDLKTSIDNQDKKLTNIRNENLEITDELYNEIEARISRVQNMMIFVIVFIAIFVVFPLVTLIWYGFRELIPYV